MLDNQGDCKVCKDGRGLGFDLCMAFQPIIDCEDRTVYAHEALVRGPNGEGAGWVFERITRSNRYQFDQACRVKAIEWAARLGMESRLSINFMPNAVYEPERCIQTTLKAAKDHDFPLDQLIFEVTESERVDDVPHLNNIITYYREHGFLTAIDDFGAGYAGLNFLAELRTDLVKLDMGLIRDIDSSRTRQAVVQAIVAVCKELSIIPVAEGIETRAELDALKDMGIRLFQGYLIAQPAFQSLPEIDWEAIK